MTKIVVQTEIDNDGIVLRPKGDVDLSQATTLRDRIAEAQRRKPRRLIIDLSAVGYMDSSGVATLVEALQIARRNDATLLLCGLQERVRSIFEIARLDMVFQIMTTVEDAKGA